MDNATDLSAREPVKRPATRQAVARRGLRWEPFASLILFFLALVQVAVRGSLDWSWVPFTLAAAAMFVFCGVLIWRAPADRPFLIYGASAIAASAILGLIPSFITTELYISIPLVADAPHWLGIGAQFLLAIGVLLVAIAYGVIHSRGGWAVFWIGALIALSGVGLVTIKAPTGTGPLDVLISTATQVIPLTWAYMFAVYLGVNRWFVRGAAMMLFYIAMGQTIAWLSPADTNFVNTRFGLGVLELLAWVLLILGALTLRPSSSHGAHLAKR
jgi:hypothetical protein